MGGEREREQTVWRRVVEVDFPAIWQKMHGEAAAAATAIGCPKPRAELKLMGIRRVWSSLRDLFCCQHFLNYYFCIWMTLSLFCLINFFSSIWYLSWYLIEIATIQFKNEYAISISKITKINYIHRKINYWGLFITTYRVIHYSSVNGYIYFHQYLKY